jgi:hypothetical protein
VLGRLNIRRDVLREAVLRCLIGDYSLFEAVIFQVEDLGLPGNFIVAQASQHTSKPPIRNSNLLVIVWSNMTGMC